MDTNELHSYCQPIGLKLFLTETRAVGRGSLRNLARSQKTGYDKAVRRVGEQKSMKHGINSESLPSG